MKKTLGILALCALVGLLGWKVYRDTRQDGAGRPKQGVRALAVEVSPVETRTLRDVAEFTGSLLPAARFDVAPKVAGRVKRLYVNIGDTVENGDLVAVLDSEEYEVQVAQARAELQVAKAGLADSQSTLDAASREFDRARELRRQKVASEAELDEAEARFLAARARHEVSKATIRQREAALAAAELRLSYASVHATWEAPADGQDGSRVVAERYVDEGELLRANDPIVSIVDNTPVVAVIFVIERDYPNVRLGQAATVTTDAWPGRGFEGRVARRSPVLREESRQARVEIEVPNPEGLLAPGMFVRVRILLDRRDAVQAVPVAALVRGEAGEGVFTVDEEGATARYVPVTTGISEAGFVEIVRPRLEGRVVTLGQHLLEDGAPVAVTGQGGGPAEAGGTAEARP